MMVHFVCPEANIPLAGYARHMRLRAPKASETAKPRRAHMTSFSSLKVS